MKAYYLLAPLGALALAGCSVYPPVAVEHVTTPAPAVTVAPPNTVILGGPATAVDSDGDGYSNAVDNYPYDARYH